MSGVIIGMPEAVEAAKKAGLGNMQISAPLVIEMAEYINRLESAEHVWEKTMMRLVGEDGPVCVEKAINKLKAQAQQATLDQFAIQLQAEVYKQVMHEFQFAKLAKEYDGMNIYQIVAKRTYDIAEAMQAESQKWQRGAV